MIGAVLWDLDGTLVDSEEHHWRSWRDTAAAEGVISDACAVPRLVRQEERPHPARMAGLDASAERIQRAGDAKEIDTGAWLGARD